jgi:soluble lytic murein transglycosylase
LSIGLAACGAVEVLGLPAAEAARRLAAGDVGFILAAEPAELAELARLGPEAPFHAALMAEAAGDAARAELLFGEAVRRGDAFARSRAEAALAERLLAASDDAPAAARAAEAAALCARLTAADGADAAARSLARRALAATGAWDRLAALDGAPSPRDWAQAYFLVQAPLGSEQRYVFRALQRGGPDLLTPAEAGVVQGRLAVADREYGQALVRFKAAIAGAPELLLKYPEALSDAGKAYQFSGAAVEGAAAFGAWEAALAGETVLPIAVSPGGREAARFRLLFYRGRMLRQAGDAAGADGAFAAALPLAPEGIQRDAALWYLLDNALTLSPAAGIALLRRYAPGWSDPAYFDDFLERLGVALVAAQAWPDLLESYRVVRDLASPATAARYAYILGRAVALGYLAADKCAAALSRDGQSVPADRPGAARYFFRLAFAADTAAFYYRCLAATYLGQNVDPVPAEEKVDQAGATAAGAAAAAAPDPAGAGEPTLPSEPRLPSAVPADGPEFAFLCAFFAYAGGRFLPAYAAEAAPRLSPDQLRRLGEGFLAVGKPGEAVRLVGLLAKRPGYRLTRRDMELLFPQPYRVEVAGAAERWKVNEFLFWGLVRTESAFIADAKSWAGAVGLAQLMPATAADVAGRISRIAPLRYAGDQPDLTDPATNALLGAWYLGDLLRRTGTPLSALLAYNGGPTRVRSWRQAAAALPEDLFLETVPIAETRDYGRKVLAAAAVYGYLYAGWTLERVFAALLPE